MGTQFYPKTNIPYKISMNFWVLRKPYRVHILPYFPFTSDDGFAVSDYRAVRTDLGDWEDIKDIGENYRLMSDVVINHASTSHEWRQFLSDETFGSSLSRPLTRLKTTRWSRAHAPLPCSFRFKRLQARNMSGVLSAPIRLI